MKLGALLNEIEIDDKVEFSDDVAKGTAAQSYAEKAGRCNAMMAEIQQALADHAARAGKDARNWGFSGDLDNVLPNLEDILHFLKS